MEMKVHESENVLLGLIIVALVIAIAVGTFLMGIKVIKKISAEISPTTYKQQVIEIRG